MTTRANRGCLIAVLATAVSLSSGAASRVAQQQLSGMVVSGIALEWVAKQHTLPLYPLEARSQGNHRDEASANVKLRLCALTTKLLPFFTWMRPGVSR
jgi:hypothetical protein